MSPLRRRMVDDMQIRNLSPQTQGTYVRQVAQFSRHFGKSPEHLGPAEIRAWQIHLAQDKGLAARSITVAVSALRFFYTVTLKRPWVLADDIPTGRKVRKLPVVLSPEEVALFLSSVDDPKHRMILTICYAGGLRISEAVRLKPAAIDSKRMVIRVEQGKGHKDRYVMLSPKLLAMLREYWRRTHPGEWLFPGGKPGQPISPLTIDLTCRQVRERCRIGKPITPHSLRHAFAVHRALTCAPSSCCSVIVIWAPPRNISGSPPARSAPPPVRWRLCGGSGQLHRTSCPSEAWVPWPTRGWKWRTCSATSARFFLTDMARRCLPSGGEP